MKFAKRMNDLKPSDIREVGKLISQRKGTISFAGGLPDPKLFPSDKLNKVTQKLIQNNSFEALQYGETLGYKPLREKVAELMAREGVKVTADSISITTGSQQAITFSTMLFLNPGDVIITENPSYLGALTAFRPFECDFVGVDIDDEGMIIEDLEKLIKNTPKAKMIYIIPNFQNPTGRTWSLNRRKKLIEIANKYDLPIVEDNAYGELRYEGERLPSLKSLDTEGRVVHLGSFSKILCPGLRVGWVCADPKLITKFELLKQGADLQSNQLAQMQVYEFLNNYNLDEHIDSIKKEYKVRLDLMLKVMDEEFPKAVKYTRPEGGMFVWAELPEGMNSREFFKKALENNVAFVPGGSFYPKADCERALRINFSNMEREKIVEGMKILADVLKKEVK